MDDKKITPDADVRCCYNCKHWHRRKYIHCQHSGPWGGDIVGDKRCTFEQKAGAQNAAIASANRRE